MLRKSGVQGGSLMQEQTTEEVRKLARQKFGRELTDAEAQILASRLPALAEAADRMLTWQSKLGDIEPATIYSVRNKARDER